jgi:hypothetical protein
VNSASRPCCEGSGPSGPPPWAIPPATEVADIMPEVPSLRYFHRRPTDSDYISYWKSTIFWFISRQCHSTDTT